MLIRLLPLTPALLLGCLAACERKPAVETTTITVETPVRSADDRTLAPVSQTKTLETARLGAAIDEYERAPGARQNATVRKAFAELDGEIAELQERLARTSGAERAEAATKLGNLQAYRSAESLRFARAETVAPLDPAGPVTIDARTGAEKAGDAARQAGQEVEHGAEKVGEALKDAAHRVGDKLR